MSTFKYLHYTLTLHSPAIVSTLSRDPNSAATQAFIPGSAVRGTVAARLISNGVDGKSSMFRSLVLSGSIRYLHAYPEIEGGRGLPMPASWKSDKDDPLLAFDLGAFSGEVSADDGAEDFKTIWPEKASVSPGRPFAAGAASGGVRSIAAPHIDTRLHQQRDRVKGRPWKDHSEQQHGVIFAYEYLEAGQVFHGVIQIAEEAVPHTEYVKKLLAHPIQAGRSRRAGYGGNADIHFTYDSLQEYDNASDVISGSVHAGQCFRAMLTSAYIGRHPETGQIDPVALEHELYNRLNREATVERRRWAFEIVGGFNQKWRLELPQARAVAGGAILVLNASETISIDALRQIEHEGLGERRTEGFGRLLFLKHDGQDTVRLSIQTKHNGNKLANADVSPVIAAPHKRQIEIVETRIVLAAARAELDRIAAIDIAAKVDKKQIPTNSLLGRLRTVLRSVLDEETASTALLKLAIWCSDDDSNPNALKRSARDNDRCTLPGGRLRLWLRSFADARDEQARWTALLNASGNPTTLTGLAARHYLTEVEAAERVLHGHAAELSVYLIDAVLSTLAKRGREGAR